MEEVHSGKFLIKIKNSRQQQLVEDNTKNSPSSSVCGSEKSNYNANEDIMKDSSTGRKSIRSKKSDDQSLSDEETASEMTAVIAPKKKRRRRWLVLEKKYNRDIPPIFPFLMEENLKDSALMRHILEHKPYKATHGAKCRLWSQVVDGCKKEVKEDGSLLFGRKGISQVLAKERFLALMAVMEKYSSQLQKMGKTEKGMRPIFALHCTLFSDYTKWDIHRKEQRIRRFDDMECLSQISVPSSTKNIGVSWMRFLHDGDELSQLASHCSTSHKNCNKSTTSTIDPASVPRPIPRKVSFSRLNTRDDDHSENNTKKGNLEEQRLAVEQQKLDLEKYKLELQEKEAERKAKLLAVLVDAFTKNDSVRICIDEEEST